MYFKAFISYNHKDKGKVARLQRFIENYKIPKSLQNTYGKKVGKIFRDQSDISAGHLGAGLSKNLSTSEFLIVACSPNSKQSDWVQAEIEHFRSLRGDACILPIILKGSGAEAFPPNLNANEFLGR